jgi:hypothetical protein
MGFLAGALRAGATVVIACFALWMAGALWFQGPSPQVARFAMLAGVAAAAALAIVGVWRRRPLWPSVFATGAAGLLLWWQAIEPRLDRDWSPEMARTVAATIEGDRATIRNIRDFDWSSLDIPAEETRRRWIEAEFDLATLKGIDIVSLYWMGPAIGHTYFSFVFEDGRTIAFSVEIRKERGEPYSPLAGFFKTYELAVLAGTERDFIGWRTFAPGENLQLFRTNATPGEARALLTGLLSLGNELAATPRFYNTLTANCTTTVWLLTQALGGGLPADWRVLLSGYLPDYLYDIGRLDRSRPLAALRRSGELQERAKAALAAGLENAAFSQALRAGVPNPAEASDARNGGADPRLLLWQSDGHLPRLASQGLGIVRQGMRSEGEPVPRAGSD